MMSETSLRHCLNGSLRPVSEEVQTSASETSLKRKEIRCVRKKQKPAREEETGVFSTAQENHFSENG